MHGSRWGIEKMKQVQKDRGNIREKKRIEVLEDELFSINARGTRFHF